MRYRHEHHAGNFADVHKHVLLLSCAAAMQRKDRGFVYAETHAGRGRYDLASPAARAGGEAERGVLRLQRHLADHPQLALAGGPLAEYVDAVAAWARGSGLRRGYPGSPVLVAGR
ncbi:MAG: 23S rRNA (adenine(2030)-N(6))-methyltransferase RlmJ, partial [Steroidobacteraceae bacterium]|nr:23S rRNA (adenine(2030)-N(6))-methyltransferase RlmJ [Steroidobacteraceae bacterium]MDW8258270.1 23S rRNA (adenine(2030)-N(6))-methyltransferase RlmJ [Gammaproteobacteria bacterium]